MSQRSSSERGRCWYKACVVFSVAFASVLVSQVGRLFKRPAPALTLTAVPALD